MCIRDRLGVFGSLGRGRYWTGEDSETGERMLTGAQLQAPHAWRLFVDGTLHRQGRAIPVLGQPLGNQVNPKVWRLQGANQAALTSFGRIEGLAPGTMGGLLDAITEGSGVSVSGPRTQPISGVVEWQGSWGTLINQVAELVGGYAIDLGNGGVSIQTGAGGIRATITEAHRIGLANSGIGLAEGVTRSHYSWPGLSTLGEVPIVGASEGRWGRRIVPVPEWFKPIR